MRIAQIAPLFESVPPRLYGGTERIVSFLTEELVRQGHEVTLFASGDSRTSARLVHVCPEALRLAGRTSDSLGAHVHQLESVIRRRREFDFIHFHTAYLHYPVVDRLLPPSLTTLHGRLDLEEYRRFYPAFRHIPYVSISNSQRTPLPDLNWAATVPHGLPRDLLEPGPGDGGYLAFIGRVSPEKRLDRAIQIARRVGMPLRIAAKVDPADREYFESRIRPLLDTPGLEWIGEIGDERKSEFLGGAAALLFPIDWPEPFGLVMVESLACGTPVIAWRNGSVPEVLEHGVTGWIVESVDEAVRAVEYLPRLSRERCRHEFERRFTAERMARNYLAVYNGLTARTVADLVR